MERRISLRIYDKDFGHGRFVVREGSELIYGGNDLQTALAHIQIAATKDPCAEEIPTPWKVETGVRMPENSGDMLRFANGLLQRQNRDGRK